MNLPKVVIYIDQSSLFYYAVLFWGVRTQTEKKEHWYMIGTTEDFHRYRKMGSKIIIMGREKKETEPVPNSAST